MWNELLLFDQLIIDGKREELKTETPIVIVNLFNHSKFVSMATQPSCCPFNDREGRRAICGCCKQALRSHISGSWSAGGSESWGL